MLLLVLALVGRADARGKSRNWSFMSTAPSLAKRLPAVAGRIYSDRSDQVWLAPGRILGRSPRCGEALIGGVQRIASIREEIAAAAPRLLSMPPIEVVPYLWRCGSKSLSGRMQILRADRLCFGVQVPAQTAVCEDLEAVRAVLLRGFSSAFYYAAQVVSTDVSAGGRVVLDFREADDMVDIGDVIRPGDWFGGDDAGRLAAQPPAVDVIGAAVEQLGRWYYLADPDHAGFEGTVGIADDVEAHILSLQREGRVFL
jgi:hypothetical protein